jgi:predicted DNA binding protein
MWFTEFQFNGSDSPVGKIAKKFNISISTYPIKIIEEKNNLLIYFACNIYGSDENKKNLIKNISKNPLIHFIEENNDFMIILFEEPKKTKEVYQQNIIHSKPIFISSDGKEIWSIASKNKENLMKAYSTLHKLKKAKMNFIKNKKINNISIAQIHPELTNKQKEAIKLAIEEGYYCIPRKIDVKTLAKKSKLAFSTYQTHLRKAESKLIPFSFQKTK